MIVVDENMMINAVDDTDMPVGTISRSTVFIAHANFRVVHRLESDASQWLLACC